MPSLRRLITAGLSGLTLSCLVLVAAFATQSSLIIGTIVMSGAPVAEFVSWVLPESFWYWVLPEGGGPATVLLFVVSAWLQLSLLSAVAVYFFLRFRANSSTTEPVSHPAKAL
jgi:hypothetical protein